MKYCNNNEILCFCNKSETAGWARDSCNKVLVLPSTLKLYHRNTIAASILHTSKSQKGKSYSNIVVDSLTLTASQLSFSSKVSFDVVHKDNTADLVSNISRNEWLIELKY
jgi:hypothetical protein